MKKIAITITFIMILALVLQGVALAALPGTGWQTSYAVMNVGGATGSFTMTAYDKDSATTYASDTFSFDNNEALTYKPGVTPTYPSGNIVGFSTALPSPFQGSVVLSGDVALTSAATLDNLPATGGTAIARYQAVENATTEILFPQVKHNWSSQTTTFYVQAAGADANVTMTYTTNDGATHTQTTTIGANKMFIFDPANATPVVASSSCGSDANTSPCFGTATAVSSSGNIAGVVVEAPHTTSPAAFVLSTRGLTADDKGTTIFAPTVKNYYYDATAGFTVMNTGSSNASVAIVLTVTDVQPGSDAADCWSCRR